MALIKCTECGKEISDKAKTCPSCGAPVAVAKKPASKAVMGCLFVIIGLSFLVIVVLAIAAGSSSSQRTPPVTSRAVATPTRAEIVLPPQQATFWNIIGTHAANYSALDNELQKSAARVARKAELQKAFPGKTVSGWVGKIESMSTATDGKASVSVKLHDSPAVLKTSSDTVVLPDSPLYAALSRLSPGATVVVSGSFFSDPAKEDHFYETSFTEAGSMREPEFFFRFDDVRQWEPDSQIPKTPKP